MMKHDSTSSTPQPPLQIEVDKPLNLQLAPSKAAGGGLVVKGVRGNAAQAGLSVGDTIVYASSFFGDELVSVKREGDGCVSF